MDKSSQDEFNLEIAEIERLIQEFKEKFENGTSDVDNFMKYLI